jgi:hypothetical protein
MKTIFCPALLLLGLLAAPRLLPAARISEPGTTFYGRVVSRLGEREFPLSTGDLQWTIAVPNQGNREYTFTTHLEPLAEGRYSYKLTLPHQALAFDLTVGDKTIPLTAAGWRIRHVKVLVSGKEAILVAPATDEFTAGQAGRAATYRIDLVLADPPVDSDGDGLPDWWEDQHGTDKWNPNDASVRPGDKTATEKKTGFTGHTFAEWRQYFFPGAEGDLPAFGRQDSDGDGVVNLLEYAFAMDPTVADELSNRLPRASMVNGRMGVIFGPRMAATDLEYRVEISGDLIQWKTGADWLEEAALPENDASAGLRCVCARSPGEDASVVFLRVVVGLKP